MEMKTFYPNANITKKSFFPGCSKGYVAYKSTLLLHNNVGRRGGVKKTSLAKDHCGGDYHLIGCFVLYGVRTLAIIVDLFESSFFRFW